MQSKTLRCAKYAAIFLLWAKYAAKNYAVHKVGCKTLLCAKYAAKTILCAKYEVKTILSAKDAVKNIRETVGGELDPDNFPIDDLKTYELFQRGETVGIFQYECNGGICPGTIRSIKWWIG